jgi:histone-lysine N-methyltransferase SETMAR
MDGKISEQRVDCKIRAQLRFLPTEIHADLQKVYGNGALKYATVCKWVVRRFNDSQESIENDPRVGRLVSVLTEKNVATMKTLIEEDARYTVQKIELSGIHLSSVLKILHERLGLHKITHCVPHLLTDEQKQSWVRIASQVIEKYEKCKPCRLEEIVTGDETWIYHFQPDSKAKNKVWVSYEGDRPVIAHHCKTSNRMLYAIFFDSKGLVLQSPVPKGSSVTGKFYRESVLTQLVDFYQKHRPRSSVRGIKFLHDNAPAHKSATVQFLYHLKESGLDVLDHPPYSPDLSRCDFWLFPKLKEMLAGHRFESCCGIGSAVYQCLHHILKEVPGGVPEMGRSV